MLLYDSQLFYEFDDSYRLPYEILENSSKIKIHDVSGKLVESYGDINSLSSSMFLNVNNYHSGVYILSIDKYSEKFSIIK